MTTKSLKQLGYKIESVYGGRTRLVHKEYEDDTIELWEDGEVYLDRRTILTLDLYKAIGLEMREKGWWK